MLRPASCTNRRLESRNISNSVISPPLILRFDAQYRDRAAIVARQNLPVGE